MCERDERVWSDDVMTVPGKRVTPEMLRRIERRVPEVVIVSEGEEVRPEPLAGDGTR